MTTTHHPRTHQADLELSFVLRCRDDEERIGHSIQRIATHLRSLGVRFELLVVDEGSGDNTMAVAALLRASHPELETLHAASGRGYVLGAERARGRIVAVSDVRSEAPLAMLGYALRRVGRGADAVTLAGRYLVFRRTRALRVLDSLATARRSASPDRRFARRARALGLGVAELHPRPPRTFAWLRDVLPVTGALTFLL